MNHRLITILISLGIIAAVVGGVVSWKWKPIIPKQAGMVSTSSPSGTSSSSGSFASSSPLVLPVPALGPTSTEAAEGIASASPTAIALNLPTDVTITVQITDTRLIAGSVNLQRLGSAGQVIAILGTLNDAGTNGDAVAGDRTYSIRVRFTEATTPIRLQVSWALRGVLKRSVSNTVVVTVVSLPPDPGAAGKQTLAGIDSDGDGVRDDIQRHIALTYPNSAKERAALTQFATGMQAALLTAGSKANALVATERLGNAQYCLWYLYGEASSPLWQELRAQYLNTRDRSRAYGDYNHLLNAEVFTGVPADQRKARCDFDPDALPN